MNFKVKILVTSLLCLNISGCEYIDNILHPDDGDEVIVDKNFRSDALQLGLSDDTITRLCTATNKISVKCITELNVETSQQEVRIEYAYNDVIQKNNYAKSTVASRVIFHLPADGATANIEFENSRAYQFNDGYQYTWQEPSDFATADLVNDAKESIATLANFSVTIRVSDSELSNISAASISNDDYSLTQAQDLINVANTVLFPELIVNVTSSEPTVPTDASFAMFTAGHRAILADYSSVFSTAIEQSWF
ncbi:hypothetical protein Shal_0765 [Shewanella halifaxensis HAW-EB4]|uniref:Uncharacterized protein n=1 Tax=Shewanella halifaxensis (strain HAW-EB4) TaxID=458817 RepID=B0TTJ7_SHEHH|nr:hypothetical protein [Shewanella halifaxensis]ABZ75340.1 hypothetical protein Shal_0765 [Shewanella halifaxensis HAW-EB4]